MLLYILSLVASTLADVDVSLSGAPRRAVLLLLRCRLGPDAFSMCSRRPLARSLARSLATTRRCARALAGACCVRCGGAAACRGPCALRLLVRDDDSQNLLCFFFRRCCRRLLGGNGARRPRARSRSLALSFARRPMTTNPLSTLRDEHTDFDLVVGCARRRLFFCVVVAPLQTPQTNNTQRR